jgi:hypothetical protein
MQDELMGLLEEVDKAPPGNRLSQSQLKTILKKWYAPNITENLIKEAYQIDLIRNTTDPIRQHGLNDVNDNTQFFLTIKGFEFLNQIRIKKALEKLDDSINKFNVSSENASKKMIELTFAIYAFTVIVVALPIYEKSIQFSKVNPPYDIIWLLVYVVSTVAVMLVYFYKFYEKKSS